MSRKILEVDQLRTSFFTHLGEVQAIRGVSFCLNEGESIGIVGESGSGKSVTSLSIMRLLQHPGKVVGGEIRLHGENLLQYTPQQMRKVRGEKIAMIFQDPMTSMNPVYTIGNQIEEMILEHKNLTKQEARERAVEMLGMVGIPSPEQRLKNYPHEFSGGMRQRAMIAMALSCSPQILIADEPTTALDVTIQAQILRLIKKLNEEMNMSTILITHDLGVVADVCQRILVMYGGLIMEEGTRSQIFYHPRHPYTMGLLKSIPKASDQKQRLIPILGTPPDLLHPPAGCPFCSRCSFAMNICREKQPPYFKDADGHRVMCWLLSEEAPYVEAYEKQKGGVRA